MMNDQDRYTFPEPLGEEPRRFTPLLAVAAVIGAAALVLIVYLLFFSGGGAPTSSPSPTPRGTGPAATAPGTGPTTGPGPTVTPVPIPSGAIDDLAEAVCAEPAPPFAGTRPSLLEAFRELCLESVELVMAEEAIDPAQVSAAGWAFAGGGADPQGATASNVYLSVQDERRVRLYLVAHSEDGATIAEGPTRVRAITADLLVFSWTRPEG